MHSLPPYTFFFICISLLISTAILILGALVLPLTPVLWTIPGAFIFTIIYHFTLVLTSNHSDIINAAAVSSQAEGRSRRRWSTLGVWGAYLLALLWAGVLTIALTFTLLVAFGKHTPPPSGSYPKINPILITMSAFAALHPFVLVAIGVVLHREGKQDRYRQKWQWKTQINTSNWR